MRRIRRIHETRNFIKSRIKFDIFAAFLLCVLFCLLSAAAVRVTARTTWTDHEMIYFIAAGDRVLPVTANAMPFYDDGWLYISSAVFTDERVQESLDISRVRDQSRGLLSLYGGNGSLVYTLGESYAMGDDGDSYAPGMIQRNGEYYVPAMAVARYFGLRYSQIDMEYGVLIWMRKEEFRVEERIFLDVAYEQIERRYEEYEQSREPGPDPDPPILPEINPTVTGNTPTPSPSIRVPHSVTPTPNAPDLKNNSKNVTVSPTPAPTFTPTPTPELLTGNQDLYLCIRAEADSITDILDFLDRFRPAESANLNLNTDTDSGITDANIKNNLSPSVTIFCDADFLREQGDILRRMVASGYTIGLLADAQNIVESDGQDAPDNINNINFDGQNAPDNINNINNINIETRNLLETLSDVMRESDFLLKQATGGKTRLILLENASGLIENLENLKNSENLENDDNINNNINDINSINSIKKETRQSLWESGFASYLPDRVYSLRTASQARELLRVVSRQGGTTVPVWLGDGVSVSGLSAFFNISAEIGDRCLPLDEIAAAGLDGSI